MPKVIAATSRSTAPRSTAPRPATQSPGPIPVRAALPEDAAAIRDVHVASVHALCAGHYSPPQLIALLGGRDAADYRAALLDEGEYVVVAPAPTGPALLGFAVLYIAEIRAVYAAPAAPRGTGRALLECLEDEARRRNVGLLTLSSSLNGVGFYEAMGYRRLSPALLDMADGQSLAVWRMEKRLR